MVLRQGAAALTNQGASGNMVLLHPDARAQVAELADALASGASGRKVVEVRVLSWAPVLQWSPSGLAECALTRSAVPK